MVSREESPGTGLGRRAKALREAHREAGGGSMHTDTGGSETCSGWREERDPDHWSSFAKRNPSSKMSMWALYFSSIGGKKSKNFLFQFCSFEPVNQSKRFWVLSIGSKADNVYRNQSVLGRPLRYGLWEEEPAPHDSPAARKSSLGENQLKHPVHSGRNSGLYCR